MFDYLSTAKRITLGFVAVAIIMVGLVIFSNRSIAGISDGFYEFRGSAERVSIVSDMLENVAEARIAALKYRQQPGEAEYNAVISNFAEVLDNEAISDSFEIGTAEQAEIAGLQAIAAEYQTAFAAISSLIAEETERAAQAADALTAFKESNNDLLQAAIESGDPIAIADAGRVARTVINPLTATNLLLSNADSNALDLFTAGQAEVTRMLDRLTTMDPPPAVMRAAGTLAEQMATLQQALEAYTQVYRDVLELQQGVLDKLGPEMERRLDTLGNTIITQEKLKGDEIATTVDHLSMISLIAGVAAITVTFMVALFLSRWVTQPILQLASVTDKLATGDNSVEITGAEHEHEIGRMAKALQVFREAQREREQGSAERARLRAEQDTVVKTMQEALKLLAEGDLDANIKGPFAPEYEDLRQNFNEAVAALQSAMTEVVAATQLIGDTTSQSNAATSDLSQRTENQAATLEQTAAALDELTASTKSAVAHAKSVDNSVKKARAEATKNGEIVAQAVSAMDEIEESSQQITQVIGVIDDIAFQTNLLALNAGVEAARAGDSGKGFAVVASEVRALAQRSADAAKEISGLIANSTRHVQQGTQLVGNAGEALSEIITQVDAIASMTTEIATSAEEQSIGLSEINIGVNQLDQATQQNAAMVQQSISRGGVLAQETSKLNDLVAKFQVTASPSASAGPPATAPVVTLEDAINKTNQPIVPAARTPANANTAAAVWEDF